MKKIVNFLLLFFFIYITIQIFINNDNIKFCFFEAINIWYYQVLPNLLPMFMINSFLLNYGFAHFLAIIFEKPFYYLFKINGIGVYIFFMSMLSGFPSSAKYIKEVYDENLISKEEATKLLAFTHFSSPLFILGFIKSIVGFNTAIIILIVHYSTNIIIGLLFRNISESDNKKMVYNVKPFGTILKNSIKNSIDTLLLILGTIIFFMIINTIINNSNLPFIFKYFTNIFLEMTNGINYVKNNPILIVMILSFGGLCVHFQVLSIIDGKIKYQPYLLARLLHAFISGMLVFIISKLM